MAKGRPRMSGRRRKTGREEIGSPARHSPIILMVQIVAVVIRLIVDFWRH